MKRESTTSCKNNRNKKEKNKHISCPRKCY